MTYKFMVPYPIVTTHGKVSEALSWDGISGWLPIYNLPGHTGVTAHFAQLPKLADQLKISSAHFRLVWMSGQPDPSQSVSILVLYYNEAGQAVFEYDWGVFMRRGAYNPDNQAVNVTDKLRALLDGVRSNPQIGLQVTGSGAILMAQLEVVYEIEVGAGGVPQEDFNDMALRVQQFEEGMNHLTQRVALVEETLETLPAVPTLTNVTVVLPAGGVNLSFASAPSEQA